MSYYPNISNPREIRSSMQNDYDLYRRGELLFPSWKLMPMDVSKYPCKTQKIAQLLVEAWDEIDSDYKSFYKAMADDENEATSVIVGTIGLNAAGIAVKREGGEYVKDIAFYEQVAEGLKGLKIDIQLLGSVTFDGESVMPVTQNNQHVALMDGAVTWQGFEPVETV